MASNFDKFQKRRVITSYFSVVLSVFLVLFLLGLLGLFVINSRRLSDNFKEDIVMTVFFKNEANDSVFKAFDAEMKKVKFAKDYKFVSKDEAAKEHKEVIGEDFMEFLGTNPLYNSYDIHLKADYVTNPGFGKVERFMRANPMVADVVYDKQLITLVNDNIKKITFWVLLISALFTIISVLLINSSLRLSIYANRFIIKTMQMVGATRWFIAKPFNIRGVWNGIISAVLAILGILALKMFAESWLPEIKALSSVKWMLILCSTILALGIVISLLSTHRSVIKYLRTQLDDLY